MIPRRATLVAVLLPMLGIGLVLTFARPALGAEFEGGETRTIAADETIDGSFYFAGQTLVVNGTITGDLIAAASEIVINGHVEGSVMAAGPARSLTAHWRRPSPPDTPAPAPTRVTPRQARPSHWGILKNSRITRIAESMK